VIFRKTEAGEQPALIDLKDLKGKRVGVQKAGLGAGVLKECGAIIVEYDNDAFSFLDQFWDKNDYAAAD